jgi:hypothetical protein
MPVLLTRISNPLTSAEGFQAAMSIEDEQFGQIWQNDSVRAMRIATLLRVASFAEAAGGTNALETCSDGNADDVRDVLSADEIRYRVRFGNWETREIAFRWEQGHYKLARIDLKPSKPAAPAAPAKPTAPAKPAKNAKKKS